MQGKRLTSCYTDSRKARSKRYSLPLLLTLILLAKLAGEDTPKGIAEWLQLRRRQIIKAFQPDRETIPSYNTIRRTLADTVSEDELQIMFRLFLYQQYGGQQSILITLDGKTLRGTIPIFMLPRKAPGWHSEQLPQQVAVSRNKEHGRLEKRTLTLIADETGFIDWPALEQVFKIDRHVVCCRTGEITEETVYGITSVSPQRGTADHMLEWTRFH